MKPGNVSTATVGPTLDMLIKDRWPLGEGPLILAEKVGCDESTIRLVIDQRNPGVSFDFVDTLFCALGRTMEDVGLCDLYWEEDLSAITRPVPVPAYTGRDATECQRGHQFTEENTYIRPDGRRACRTCKTERDSRTYLERKARRLKAAA